MAVDGGLSWGRVGEGIDGIEMYNKMGGVLDAHETVSDLGALWYNNRNGGLAISL